MKCVADEYKCDGLADCDDASDELPVLCKFSSFYFKECKKRSEGFS